LTRARPFCFVENVPPRAPLLALSLALATACNRTPAGSDAPAQAPSTTSTPTGASSGIAPGLASADAPAGSAAAPPAPGSADDPRPPASAAHDPGRYRAPVVMQVRGGSGTKPGPIVVTIEVREAVAAPGKLALSYPLAGGKNGQKSLSVSLATVGTQTHTVELEANALAPVKVTLDASDPAKGAGLHAERVWPEAATPAPPRPPGPPGGRPPFPRAADSG
jgi:hypothetical protein